MSNIIKAKITVEGTRPLFFNKFNPELMSLEKKERKGKAGNDPDEWRQTCMVTENGQLYLEGTYFWSAIREAAKYTKRGRGSLQNPVTATLQVLDECILIDRFWAGYPNGKTFDVLKIDPPTTDKKQKVYLDIRGVSNPATKAKNIRYRIVTSPGWQCSFELTWDKTVVSKNEMESILNDAGQLVGVGNARTIGMGRFRVVSIET